LEALATKGVEMLAPQKDRGNATLITLLSFIILERWALPLFKAVGLVPENNQAAARTDIACAPCEVCSHHLGLESLDLLPPFKDMYICTYATSVIVPAIGSAYKNQLLQC
jgi:hypothetical protein